MSVENQGIGGILMYVKRMCSPMEFKVDDQGADTGEFECAFAQLNVIDLDGDVTVPGAFTSGEKVRVSYWAHGWDQLPVGRGTIEERDGWAICKGRFFLDTASGVEHYKTVKNLADLQEWSYGFDILDAELGVFNGEEVRFLKRLKVHEVAPVMLGAGIGTHTTAIKGISVDDLLAVLGASGLERVEGKESQDQTGNGASRSYPRDPLNTRLTVLQIEIE